MRSGYDRSSAMGATHVICVNREICLANTPTATTMPQQVVGMALSDFIHILRTIPNMVSAMPFHLKPDVSIWMIFAKGSKT